MQGLNVEQAKLYVAVKRIGDFGRASSVDKDRVLRDLVKIGHKLVDDMGFTNLISNAPKVRYNPYKGDVGNIDFYRDAHRNGYFAVELFVRNYLQDITYYIEFNNVDLTGDESEIINIYLFNEIVRVGLNLRSRFNVNNRRFRLGHWLRVVRMYQAIQNTNQSVSQQVYRAYVEVSEDILLFLKRKHPRIVDSYLRYVQNLDKESWDRLVEVVKGNNAIKSLKLNDNYYNMYGVKTERW